MRWRWPVGVVHSKTPGPVWVRWNPPSVLTWWSRLQSGPRLVALVVPSSRWNSTVWSRSQDSAGAGHPGRAQARSRTWMWVARSAGGRYLVRPTSSTAPLRGSVTIRRHVPSRARARAASAVIGPYPARSAGSSSRPSRVDRATVTRISVRREVRGRVRGASPVVGLEAGAATATGVVPGSAPPAASASTRAGTPGKGVQRTVQPGRADRGQHRPDPGHPVRQHLRGTHSPTGYRRLVLLGGTGRVDRDHRPSYVAGQRRRRAGAGIGQQQVLHGQRKTHRHTIQPLDQDPGLGDVDLAALQRVAGPGQRPGERPAVADQQPALPP